MERFPLFLVALLALCVVPSALAIKCFTCSNIPEAPGSTCNAHKVESIECHPLADRCQTMQGTLNFNSSFSVDFVWKNCSYSQYCNPTSPMSVCNIFNKTRSLTKCNTECCEDDLCNGPSAGSGNVRISGLLTSIAAILMTVVLNIFQVFY